MVLPLEGSDLLSPFLATLAGGADVTEEDLETFSLASSTVLARGHLHWSLKTQWG